MLMLVSLGLIVRHTFYSTTQVSIYLPLIRACDDIICIVEGGGRVVTWYKQISRILLSDFGSTIKLSLSHQGLSTILTGRLHQVKFEHFHLTDTRHCCD